MMCAVAGVTRTRSSLELELELETPGAGATGAGACEMVIGEPDARGDGVVRSTAITATAHTSKLAVITTHDVLGCQGPGASTSSTGARSTGTSAATGTPPVISDAGVPAGPAMDGAGGGGVAAFSRASGVGLAKPKGVHM